MNEKERQTTTTNLLKYTHWLLEIYRHIGLQFVNE